MTSNGTSLPEVTVVRTSRGLSIAGTRITLYDIMDCLADGWPPHLIRDWFNLTEHQMLDLVQIRILDFAAINLPFNSSDRTVWRTAQAQRLLLLTDNRNMEGDDSLEQVIRDENTPSSLPVLTITRRNRLVDQAYRIQCVERLIEVVIDLENHLGAGRVFIP